MSANERLKLSICDIFHIYLSAGKNVLAISFKDIYLTFGL
jgi:hypothetical protein